MARLLTRALGAAAVALALGAAASANATTFIGSDTVTANTSSNGLQIAIANSGALNFNLTNVGDQTGYIDLFKIYTNEQSVQPDDEWNKNIKLSFNFTQPLPGASGSLNGQTDGDFDGFFFLGFIPVGDGAQGELNWNNTSTNLNFGSGYQLKVVLESKSETFNAGNDSNNLNPGIGGAADVRANFILEKAPAAVPEPASWALMIGGMGLAGAMMRRRRASMTLA